MYGHPPITPAPPPAFGSADRSLQHCGEEELDAHTRTAASLFLDRFPVPQRFEAQACDDIPYHARIGSRRPASSLLLRAIERDKSPTDLHALVPEQSRLGDNGHHAVSNSANSHVRAPSSEPMRTLHPGMLLRLGPRVPGASDVRMEVGLNLGTLTATAPHNAATGWPVKNVKDTDVSMISHPLSDTQQMSGMQPQPSQRESDYDMLLANAAGLSASEIVSMGQGPGWLTTVLPYVAIRAARGLGSVAHVSGTAATAAAAAAEAARITHQGAQYPQPVRLPMDAAPPMWRGASLAMDGRGGDGALGYEAQEVNNPAAACPVHVEAQSDRGPHGPSHAQTSFSMETGSKRSGSALGGLGGKQARNADQPWVLHDERGADRSGEDGNPQRNNEGNKRSKSFRRKERWNKLTYRQLQVGTGVFNALQRETGFRKDICLVGCGAVTNM